MRYFTALQLIFLAGCGGNFHQNVYTTVVEETPLEWVDPCPEINAKFPELLLLHKGVYYAVYYDEYNNYTHLVEVVPGFYRTTDSRNAKFEVTVEGGLICHE